jgi:toxin ParE1/3/4
VIRVVYTRQANEEAARLLIEGHYLVLYEAHPDADDGPVDWVEVVSIVDGRRDLTELF